jgi:hypothetical protein
MPVGVGCSLAELYLICSAVKIICSQNKKEFVWGENLWERLRIFNIIAHIRFNQNSTCGFKKWLTGREIPRIVTGEKSGTKGNKLIR